MAGAGTLPPACTVLLGCVRSTSISTLAEVKGAAQPAMGVPTDRAVKRFTTPSVVMTPMPGVG
jgi:hypothetical protein